MRVLAVLLLAVLVAGCSQAPAEQAAPVEKGETVLHGVVVDASITPLANVTVTVSEGETLLRTNTSADGAWEFRGLSSGSHFVAASRVGYLPAQVRVDVAPSLEPPEAVKLVMEVDFAFRAPYVVTYEFPGLIECGAVVNAPPPVGFVAVAACQVPNDATGTKVTNDQFRALHPIEGGKPTWIQSELVWDATNEFGRSFLMYLDELNNTGKGSARPGSGTSAAYTELKRESGTSPVVAVLQEDEMDRLGRGFDLQLRVFSWSNDGVPAGATVEQSFTIYTHVFYGFAPPEGWTFTKDGAIEAPPL